MTTSFRSCRLAAIVMLLGLGLVCKPGSVFSQDKMDPTAQSDVIKQTISKIKDVEKLDEYIAKNKELTETNKQLQAQVASINKQVAKLTTDLAEQQAKLRKQLLQMPSFELKSKIISYGQGMAILKSKDRYYRIRVDAEMSVPVADGVYVLMHVKKITKDVIELHFPELERDLFLYD